MRALHHRHEHSAWKRPRVEEGDTIALVAPARALESPESQSRLLDIVCCLEHHYRVVFEPWHPAAGMFARSANDGAAEINRALANPAVRAVVALRGGYGSMRLLPRLDHALIERSQAVLVGFSDVTALHHAWAHARVCSVHGTMAEGVLSLTADQFDGWRQVLAGAVARPQHGLVAIRMGECAGRVLGGNLSLLAALACTPWAMPAHGSVLFIEDVSEPPYRIDRMLTSLRLAGWWERVAAVILGSFHDCQPGEDGVTVERVLREHFSDVAFPVVSGYPAGHFPHGYGGHAFRFGDWAHVDADRGTVWFSAGDGPPL